MFRDFGGTRPPPSPAKKFKAPASATAFAAERILSKYVTNVGVDEITLLSSTSTTSDIADCQPQKVTITVPRFLPNVRLIMVTVSKRITELFSD